MTEREKLLEVMKTRQPYGTGKIKVQQNFDNAVYSPEDRLSFSSLRSRAIGMREIILERRKSIEAERERDSKIYNAEFLRQKHMRAATELSEFIGSSKRALRKDLNDLMNARQERIEGFYSETPSQEVVNYLQLMTMRTKLSESDVDGMLKKCGTCYQALSVARDLAEKSGLVFSLPLNQETSEQKMKDMHDLCESIIDSIADEDHTLRQAGTYYAFNYANEGSEVDNLFSDADLDPAVALGEPKTLLQRVNESLTEAVEAEDAVKFRDISKFALKNADNLKTEKDVEIEQKQAAERLEAEAAELGI